MVNTRLKLRLKCHDPVAIGPSLPIDRLAIAKSQPAFLDLPAEVRHIIYEQYFKNAYIISEVPHPATMYDGDLEGIPSIDHEFFCPRQIRAYHDLWLLSRLCKQIAQEVHPVFFRTATFVFKGRRPFLDSFHNVRIPGIPQTLFFFNNRAFNPFTSIQSLWLDLTRHCWRTRNECNSLVEENTKSILTIVQRHLPALRSLSITFDDSAAIFSTYNDNDSDQGTDLSLPAVFLARLCGFTALETFSISYIVTEENPAKSRENLRKMTIVVLDQLIEKHIHAKRQASTSSRGLLVKDGSTVVEIEATVHKAISQVVMKNKTKFRDLIPHVKDWY